MFKELLNHRFSQGFTLLIIILVAGNFLVPQLMGYSQSDVLERYERSYKNKIMAPIENREQLVIHSINKLKITDRRFKQCIERIAIKRASVQGNFIESVQELNGLSCGRLGIKSINGIENLGNIQYLDISENSIVDITPLTKLQKLTELNLSGNPLFDLRILKEIPRLKKLTISNVDRLYCSDIDRFVYEHGIKELNSGNPIECKGRASSYYVEDYRLVDQNRFSHYKANPLARLKGVDREVMELEIKLDKLKTDYNKRYVFN